MIYRVEGMCGVVNWISIGGLVASRYFVLVELGNYPTLIGN